MDRREKFLWGSQVMTALLLIVVMNHYRVLPKLQRAWFDEGRIPGVAKRHQLNRNYKYQREIFRLYDSEGLQAVIFGDSHVSGISWPELLPRAGIAGRGIPGDTAEGVRHRIGDLAGEELDWVGILVGTNDVLEGQLNSRTRESLRAAIESLQRSHSKRRVRLISVPPFAAWVESSEKRNQQVRRLNQELESMASDVGCEWLDLHSMLVDEGGFLAREMTTDGIHLSAAAYRTLAELLAGETFGSVR